MNLIEYIEEQSMPEPMSGCWLWLGGATTDRHGLQYGYMTVKGKQCRVHRVMWQETFGQIPQDYFVCHQCDIGLCVNPSHLFIGTARDNNKDRRKKKRDYWFKSPEKASQALARARKVLKETNGHPRGENHYHARLSETDILKIRELSNNGEMQKSIANKFGISQPTTSNIINGRSWRHVI